MTDIDNMTRLVESIENHIEASLKLAFEMGRAAGLREARNEILGSGKNAVGEAADA